MYKDGHVLYRCTACANVCDDGHVLLCLHSTEVVAEEVSFVSMRNPGLFSYLT